MYARAHTHTRLYALVCVSSTRNHHKEGHLTSEFRSGRKPGLLPVAPRKALPFGRGDVWTSKVLTFKSSFVPCGEPRKGPHPWLQSGQPPLNPNLS